MAERNNAVCSICGKGYYMCLSCKDKMSLSPWKLHTDTSEHYKVYQILRGLTIGVYSEDEAKKMLQMVDLTDLDCFKDNIKNRINSILAEDIIVEPIETVSNIQLEETSNVKRSRKRKNNPKTSETEK